MWLAHEHLCYLTRPHLVGHVGESRSDRVCPCSGGSRQWPASSSLKGLSPKVLTLFGGSLPGARGALLKGNADGARGIFGTAGRMWASVLRLGPPKKRPCASLVRLMERITNIGSLLSLKYQVKTELCNNDFWDIFSAYQLVWGYFHANMSGNFIHCTFISILFV